MATLTLTAKSTESQLPSETTLSTSAIPIQNFDANNYPAGIDSNRPYQIRSLNVFDFTTNIYPPTPQTTNLNNIQGIQITGLGYYNDLNNEVPVTSFSYVKPFTYNGVVQVGNYFSKADLGYTLHPILGIFVETWETTMHDCIFIKYKIKYNDNSFSPNTVLKLYRGNSQVTYLRFTEICNITITPGTLNIIKISDIQGLNPTKNLTINQILTTSSPRLPDLFPQVLTEGTSFIPRIYFSNSTFIEDYINLVVVDPRLTYAGNTIYEGQGIPIDGINNGLLQFNAEGLTSAQISNYKFYVLYEGFASGDAFVKSI